MQRTYDNNMEARRAIEEKCTLKPDFGIILGTGLGKLADSIETDTVISYEDIPHFARPTAETHAGKLIMGTLSGKKVMAMQGRFHYYEGYTMGQIVFPVQVMKFMGAHTLIVSNACGGVNPLFPPETLMCITDHINLLGDNPLIGINDNRIGPRYPDMSDPYAKELINLAKAVAQENKIPLERGVYAAMSGPSLETRAEYRMLRILGADVIGMSTVPEVICASHVGLKVLGISVVTDACLPDALEPADINKIIAAAAAAEPKLVLLIRKVLEAL
ncbi:MAG: purine-nucleoside phosphorylase [Chitinivibrionales bacterium]|nr:purine-nucleoside phosphorylase [Chitinivibrionales bacterium]